VGGGRRVVQQKFNADWSGEMPTARLESELYATSFLAA